MTLVDGRKEGNVLFNDALITFHLRLYGVRHMVKDHSDSERGNPLPPLRLPFPLAGPSCTKTVVLGLLKSSFFFF